MTNDCSSSSGGWTLMWVPSKQPQTDGKPAMSKNFAANFDVSSGPNVTKLFTAVVYESL